MYFNRFASSINYSEAYVVGCSIFLYLGFLYYVFSLRAPLFMLFSYFQSNHSVYKPLSLPFLPSLQLFQWLVQESSQTHICLPETFHQRLAKSILHKTLPPLAIHRGIPISLQTKLREPHLLNPTNHNQLHHKLKNLRNPFMTTKKLYPWATSTLLSETSSINTEPAVLRLNRGDKAHLSFSKEHDDKVTIHPCFPGEPVCTDGRGNNGEPFFFVYATVFKKVRLRLPLTRFERELLTELDVAPAQLHPNS